MYDFVCARLGLLGAKRSRDKSTFQASDAAMTSDKLQTFAASRKMMSLSLFPFVHSLFLVGN